MRGPLFVVAVLVLSVAWACGTAALEATVTDSPDALTADGGDNLFDLTLTQAADRLPLAEVRVSTAAPGGVQAIVEYSHEDRDGDGQFSEGDTLHCRETPLERYNQGNVAANHEFRVLLLRDPGGNTLKELADLRWIPEN